MSFSALDYADYTALTFNHELDRTDQACTYPLNDLDHEVEVGDLSDV